MDSWLQTTGCGLIRSDIHILRRSYAISHVVRLVQIYIIFILLVSRFFCIFNQKKSKMKCLLICTQTTKCTRKTIDLDRIVDVYIRVWCQLFRPTCNQKIIHIVYRKNWLVEYNLQAQVHLLYVNNMCAVK